MFIVICYDIPDNGTRNNVAKTLKGFGYRVQESVFECEVTAREFEKLKKRVAREIDPKVDSVRYYNLCAACIRRIEIMGLGEIRREEPFFVV